MKRIRIVTDSTADLPQEFVKANNIHVIPLYVNFSHGTYRDGVDLGASEFYPLLKKAGDNLPKTSTPSREDFLNAYRTVLKEGDEIISIHISSGLSGTTGVAEAAAKAFQEKILVFDSRSISLGIGLQVLEAMEMIKKNMSLDNIYAHLKEIRERTEVLFSLDTLEYLEKGGRIGKVSALLGAILKIKPVIRVEKGVYIPLDKVRNQAQAIKRLISHMEQILKGTRLRHVAVAHGAAEEAAMLVKKLIEEKFQTEVALFRETGPVIGVHTGPGTLGIAFTY